MVKVTHVRHKITHHKPSPAGVGWDDLRLFVTLVRLGTIRGAAEETGLTVLTIRRKIEKLETELNGVLLTRSKKGVALTPEGESVYREGLEMLRTASRVNRIAARREKGLRTAVKIGITEGLGTFWLIPRAIDLIKTHSDILPHIKPSMNMPDLAALEVDMAVTLDRPTNPDLKVTRLGWLHLGFFASREYIADHGEMIYKEQLGDHAYIDIVGAQIQSKRIPDEVTSEDPRRFVSLRVESSSAQVMAVTHGAGIALLPTYAPLVTHSLVHIAKDYTFPRNIWLVYHPHAAEFDHVRRTIDWVRASFDCSRYPWFREKYISPAEVEAIAKDRGLAPMFAMFRE